MKKINYIFSVLFLFGILVSCKNEKSLQQYFVDGADNKEFISADLSTTLLKVSEVDLTPEQKEAYKSLRKINLLAYRLKEDNSY